MQKMQSQAKGQIACQIASRMLALAEERPFTDPATWIAVAEKLNCYVKGLPSFDSYGFYMGMDDTIGLIFYNSALPPVLQARVLVHEIAHHLCATWLPLILTGDSAVYNVGYIDDPRHLSHEVSRLAEDLCMGEGR